MTNALEIIRDYYPDAEIRKVYCGSVYVGFGLFTESDGDVPTATAGTRPAAAKKAKEIMVSTGDLPA